MKKQLKILAVTLITILTASAFAGSGGFSGVPEYIWNSDGYDEKTHLDIYLTAEEVEKAMADCKAEIQDQISHLKNSNVVILSVSPCKTEERTQYIDGKPFLKYGVKGSFQFIR